MSMQDGMTNRSPKAVDKSMTPPPGRVDDDPVRKGPAKTPATLGPRTA